MTAPIQTYSIAEVAKLLKVSQRTIFVLLKSGELRRTKIRRRTIIRETDLNRFLDRNTGTSTA